MSKLAAIGPEEWKAITQQERNAWRDLASTKRVAGWLQESIASAEAAAVACRARAGEALNDGPETLASVQRSYVEAKERAWAFRHVLTAIESVGEPAPDVTGNGEAP